MSWQYFRLEEFACKCGRCRANFMQRDFIDKLEGLRGRVGVPLVVSSGYRCSAHNLKVSTTGPSGPHTTGRAVDFRVAGKKAQRLVHEAMQMMAFTGIGVHQRGPHEGRFIHLDDLASDKRPWIWSY